MASPAPIYDPDKKEAVTKPDLRVLEGGGETSLPTGNLSTAPEPADLAQKEAAPSDPDQVGRGYTGKSLGSQNFHGRLNAHRKLMLGLGAGGAITLLIVGGLFSFLNVFKLDGLLSSIEQRAFLRTNATLDTRSSKWINSYIEARLLDMGDNPNFDNPNFKQNDNLLFRASRVDTNSPFTDWYRTLRTSKFEQEVFEKHGIKFTSMVTASGEFRTGYIDINGQKPIPFNVSEFSTIDFNKLSQGDIDIRDIRAFGDVVDTKVFKTNKEARRTIKEVVKNNTRWDQVYKRRALRKAIQNMTGVKDWRFFETTRDNAAQKRVDIRNKIIDKMVPDKLFIGKVTRCLFGVDSCKPSRDVADPQNRATATTSIGKPNDKTAEQIKEEDKNLGGADRTFTPGQLSETLTKILQKANLALKLLNLPNTLDMISFVDGNIKNLVKLVVVARGAQAAGLYQVFATSRDQLKTGQVTSQEVNDFMNVISTAGSSDAQAKVIDGNGDPSVASSDIRCTQEARALYDTNPVIYKERYGVYAPLCEDQRIGSTKNAQKTQDIYKQSIGNIVGPIAHTWNDAKGTPVISQFISVVSWLNNRINSVLESIIGGILNTLGLKDNVEALITWVFGKLANFLGVVIISGNESPGTIYNWLVQGGAYTAESAARQQGAALTNNASQAATQITIARYEKSKKENTSLYDSIASLSNPDSLAYRWVYSLSNIKSDPSTAFMSSLHGMWQGVGKNFATLFIGQSHAATPNGYTASKFADIETYDYPQQCYDMDPITSKPLEDGTNALTIFKQNHIAVTQANLNLLNNWGTQSNSDIFYKTIYDIINASPYTDRADDIAVQIYNCNLLDTAVRGSLGYIYGYTKDNADLVQ